MDKARHVFRAADYIVCGTLLVLSVGIGLYYSLTGGRQRSSAEYVLANRRMTVLPVTLSLLASYFSGISLQGIPSDVYFRGTMGIWAAAPVFLSGFVALYYFVPLYYSMGISSVFEYLEVRFSKVVLACGVFAFVLFALLYAGLVTFAASVAATAVMDVSYAVAAVCLIGVCTIYTVAGGIKAVLWTDTLQMLVIFCTVIIVIVKGNIEMGGIRNVWRIAEEGQRIQFLNISPDLTEYYTVWGLFIGQLGTAATLHVSNQYMVQRYLTCKSVAVAKTALIGFMVGSMIFTFLCVLGGVTIYAYYSGCDPHARGLLTQQDEILPYFIIEIFRGAPGVAGILLSGIFGAALSTLSSVFNGVAALFGEHVVKPYWKIDDANYTLVLKGIATAVSFATLGMAFLMPRIGSVTPTMFAIGGASHGPVLALYLLGALYPRCGAKAAVASYLIGAAVGMWLGIGNIIYGGTANADLPLSTDNCVDMNQTTGTPAMIYFTNGQEIVSTDTHFVTNETEYSRPLFGPLYSVSRVWYPTLTCLLTIIIGVVSTLIFGGNEPGSVDPRLYVSLSMPKWCVGIWPFGNRSTGPTEEKLDLQEMTPMYESQMSEDSGVKEPKHGQRLFREMSHLSGCSIPSGP